MLSSWEKNISWKNSLQLLMIRDLMHRIAYIKLIKFSSVNVAVAQFTANNTLNSFNKLKKLR